MNQVLQAIAKRHNISKFNDIKDLKNKMQKEFDNLDALLDFDLRLDIFEDLSDIQNLMSARF